MEHEPNIERLSLQEIQVQAIQDIREADLSQAHINSRELLQYIFEVAAAHKNKTAAEATWPHVKPSFANTTRWYDIDRDPVLLPRVYECLLAEPLHMIDQDYPGSEGDENRRLVKEHNAAVVSLGETLAVANCWEQIPALFSKMYNSTRTLFERLADIAIEQHNQEVLFNLIKLQTAPNPAILVKTWGGIVPSVGALEPNVVIDLLSRGGFEELEPLNQDLQEATIQEYSARIDRLVTQGDVTIALAKIMGEEINTSSDQTNRTNWSNKFAEINIGVIDTLREMKQKGIPSLEACNKIAELLAGAGSIDAINQLTRGLLQNHHHGRTVDPNIEDYQQIMTRLIEVVDEPDLLEQLQTEAQANQERQSANEVGLADQPDRQAPAWHSLWPNKKIRSTGGYSTYDALVDSIREMSDMPLDAALEIQDPRARTDALLAKLNQDNKDDLAPDIQRSARAIFNVGERVMRQFALVYCTT